VIVIASLLTAATVAAATATAAIAASASAQNQNATESARAAVCAMCELLCWFSYDISVLVRVKTYAKVRTVRRGPVRNMRTLSAVPRTQTLYSNTATDTQMHPTPSDQDTARLHTAVELETSREPDDTRRQKCMTLIANWWMGTFRSENCRFNLRSLSQNALVRARGGPSARSHSAARPSCHGVSARPSVQHATRARQASDGFLP
jgi:hypothetical protein